MLADDFQQRLRARHRAFSASFRRALERAFPERQILIRDMDRMSIYHLSRKLQALCAALALGISMAMLAGIIGAVFGPLAVGPREVSAVIATTLDVASDAMEPAEAIEGAAARLSIEIAPPTGADAQAVRIQGAGPQLQAQLAAIDDRVFALVTRGLGTPPPAQDARAARLAGLEGLNGVQVHVANIERHVERLASSVSTLRDAEASLVREMRPQLAFFIATAERVIRHAGLDVDDLLREGQVATRAAVGGPFVAAVSGPLAVERASLQADLAYWQALRGLVRCMPLAAPLDRYAVSSSFGGRRDPMNARKAMHNGLDLISVFGAPIKAPAPGVVTFAGRNGGYGNFIEIDHGKSLRTRFAHLRSIKVKKGDTVGFLQPIGSLGNTGRSTGAHLHYEVLIAGRPVNPMNFIRAGQHVFQE